jgi:hypothetical protein
MLTILNCCLRRIAALDESENIPENLHFSSGDGAGRCIAIGDDLRDLRHWAYNHINELVQS